MKSVTAHFEFGGAFWGLVSLLIVAALAVYFRDELRVFVERIRQGQEG
jgi:hypothetical protein